MQNKGMKGTVFVLWFMLAGLCASAQYFFNDIVNTALSQQHFSTLQKERIQKITVKAYDSEGEIIEDFILYQDIDPGKKSLTTYSKTNLSDASILQTTYNGTNKPILVVDSSAGATTRTRYIYDTKGLLVSLQSKAVQLEQMENIVTEERKYFYNNSGVPDSMWRIKGATDTILVKFMVAENGLPGEEQWFKNGEKIETWFYYYDLSNRISDIVRFNTAAKQMLPDYLFSYNESGHLSTKVSVTPGTNIFRIWQYIYNEKGLKVEEKVMNRQRKLEGRLVYEYQ